MAAATLYLAKPSGIPKIPFPSNSKVSTSRIGTVKSKASFSQFLSIVESSSASSLQLLPLQLGLHEPSNALSLPTWAVHVSSVVEWILAMALVWQYGDKPGYQAWKGLSWGMVPLLGGAFCACTWHFFYNSDSLEICTESWNGMKEGGASVDYAKGSSVSNINVCNSQDCCRNGSWKYVSKKITVAHSKVSLSQSSTLMSFMHCARLWFPNSASISYTLVAIPNANVETIKEQVTFIYLQMRMLGIELDEFTYRNVLVALDSLQIMGFLHFLLGNNGTIILEALVASDYRHGRLLCVFKILPDLLHKKLIFEVLINSSPQQSNSSRRHGTRILGYTLLHDSGSKIYLGIARVTIYSSVETWDWYWRVFNSLVENVLFIFDIRMISYEFGLSVVFATDIVISLAVHATGALVYGHLIGQREKGSHENGGENVQQKLDFKIVLQYHENGFICVIIFECQDCYVAVVFHRKMIDWGGICVTSGLLKWKALPPKHGTWKYSSLRTRMFEGAGIVTVNNY